MSNKKELDVNELDKVGGGVTAEECGFKYELYEHIKIAKPFSTMECEIIARGYKTSPDKHYYYLMPCDDVDQPLHKGWYSESGLFDSGYKHTHKGITKVDGN